MGSLPESYDNFLTSLNARSAEELDWDNIKGLLIEEHLKRKEKSESVKGENALYSGKYQRGRNKTMVNFIRGPCKIISHHGTRIKNGSWRFKKQRIVCFKCNQVGHIVKNCPYNASTRADKGEHSSFAKGDGLALISSTKFSDKWFVDSTAMKHMTHDESLLINYTSYLKPTEIFLGDNTIVHAIGEGMVKVPIENVPNSTVNLQKVLYVPKLAKNLISVPALVSEGAEVHFIKDRCMVYKHGKELEIGQLDGMLYTVNKLKVKVP